jgi:leucyl/phenylalanyl-tRNA--protein transferase
VLWWSPDPREVLLPGEFHCARSLRRTIRREAYEWRMDGDFAAVIRACAAPRSADSGTWITPAMISAYERMHELGHAHSIETWQRGMLVGGLYGIRLGRVFFGESMFSRAKDGSKAALAGLMERFEELGLDLIDCQMASAHLRSLGSRALPREEFLARLAAAMRPGPAA